MLRPAGIAWIALALSLTYLVAVGAHSLRAPGIFYDEAYDAIPALQVLQGERPECAKTMRIGDRRLPLMMHPHIGATSAYTSLAAFALLGPSVESLRLSQLAVGAIGLVLLFFLARSWFGDGTAAIAVALCGSAPAFVWWSRGGANWTVPLLPLALGMLLALTHWWRSRRPWALVVAAFCCGLGITTKVLFGWLALPMLLTGLLAIGPRRIATTVRETPWRLALASLLAFLVGLAPLIAHNVPEPKTLDYVLRSSVTTGWGHDNREFLTNLRLVAGYFLQMLDGEVQMSAPITGLAIGGGAMVLALLYGAARVSWEVRGRMRHEHEKGASVATADDLAARTFLVLVPLTVLPQSTFTTSALSATYLFLIVPLVWLLVAVPIADLLAWARSPSRPRLSRTVCAAGGVLLFVPLLASHLTTNLGLLRFFDATGGRGQWSDAIERVAETLERDFAGRPVVALDWGFARSLELLTARRLRVIEGHEFLPAPTAKYPERCRELLAEPDPVFLVHDESFAYCPGCFASCAEVARAGGRNLVIAREIRDGEGNVHTRLYEVES